MMAQVFGNRDPTTPMGYNISPLRQQLFGTLLVLGNILSSASSGVVSHFMGRRAAIWVGCAFLNLATVLTMVVNTIGGAYAARFLVGVAQGFLYTFFNLYLQVRSSRTPHHAVHKGILTILLGMCTGQVSWPRVVNIWQCAGLW